MITYFIVGAFLLSTLVLGLWAGKDVKTIKDYAIANRELGLGVLTMTLLATVIGSSDIEDVWAIHKYGHVASLVGLGMVFSFLFAGLFVVPKLVHFTDCLTIGDVMGRLYNQHIRIFTGIIGFFFSSLIIGAQLLTLGECGIIFLGLTKGQGAILFGVVLVIYATLGGMRAVAYTDVLQFVCLVLLMTFIVGAGIYQVGGLKELINSQPLEKCVVYHHPRFIKTLQKILFFTLFPTLLFAPPVLQRMLMTKNKRQVRYMLFTAGFCYLVVQLTIILLGMCAWVLYPNDIAPFMIAFMAKALFASPIMHGILFCGIIAVLMSTADSHLHAAGVLIVHDVIKPLCDRYGIRFKEFKWIKWVTLLIGLFSIFLTVLGIRFLYGQMIFRFYFYAMSFFSTLIIPLIAGVMGLKTDAKSFVFALFTTLPTIALLYMIPYPLNKFAGWSIVILVHTIVFFASHYIQHGGWATVQRTDHTIGYGLWVPSWRGFANTLASYVPTPSKLAKIAQRKVNDYGSEPFLFTLFIIIFSMITIISVPLAPKGSFLFLGVIYVLGLIFCVGLMLESLWPRVLKPYFDVYWFFTLFYCVPFVNTMLFFHSQQDIIALTSLALAFLLLMVLVDWRSFLLLTTMGIGFAVVAFKILTGSFLPVMSFSTKWSLSVSAISMTLTGLFFAQRREMYNKVRLKKANLYAGSIAYETKNYLNTSRFAGLRINEAIQKKELKALDQGDLYTIPKQLAEELMLLGPELEEGADQSLSKISMFMSALKENIISAKLSVRSMKVCVKEAVDNDYFKGEEVIKGLVLRLDDDFKAKVSDVFFKHVIYNLVKNAYWHGGATQVVITLNASKRSLYVEDNGCGIDSVSLPYIFDLFYSGGSTSGSGIGLALVKVIVEGFGGSIYCDSKQGDGSYTKFVVSFPEL